MAKYVTTYQPSAKAKRFISKIKTSLQKALGDFLEIGRTLKKAEVELGRKEWLDMVNNELPFSRRTAEKLVKIASDKRITNPKNAPFLPPHWTSLHELTLLSDAQFKAGLKSGVIHPEAERKDITNLKTRAKAKRFSPKVTTKKQPTKNRPNDAPLEQSILDHEDQRRPTKSEKLFLSVAEFTTDKEYTPEEAETIEAALTQFAKDHGLKLTLAGHLSQQALLKQIEHDLFGRMDEIRRETKDNDLQQITDAFFQFETGKFFDVNPDGSFHANDLRNPKNPFHDFDKQQLYGYCLDLQLMTQYTPIEYLDTNAHIQMLAWRILTGNEKQRTSARDKLRLLAEAEKIRKKKAVKYFERKKLSYDKEHMNRNYAQAMLELIDG